MRGYFGIGAEGISKPMNLGNLIRSAHAFGASFVFLVDPHHTIGDAPSDTSHASSSCRCTVSTRSKSSRCRRAAP